ncbi:MAG: DNA modification methylase [Bryobacteraceae bacterium]
MTVEQWPASRVVAYARNARKIPERAVDKVAASIKEFGWRQPIVVDAEGVIVVGHARLLAAKKLGMTEVPVHVASNLTPAQIKAYRLMDNRSHEEASWDLELLSVELSELQALAVDLGSLTGFDNNELSRLLTPANQGLTDENEAPPLPVSPVSQPGDVWLLGPHRLVCGDATDPATVAKCLNGTSPSLMVTDPPYGIELDSEWRDRAGLNSCGPAEPSYLKKRTEGHRNTSISSDTRADWSDAFALVPSLEVGYVWHASKFTREVLDGLLRIGFLHHQQIIWNKGRTVLTRTHYWFQHEPCWYVRKKNAPWFGKAGENSTIWDSPSPKFIMGGSKEEKFDHPTQKPVDLMRRPILNHLMPGEIVYEPFSGSGTTLLAAEQTGRVCLAIELDPGYADCAALRWQAFTGKEATLEGHGATFEHVKTGRRMAAEDAIKEEVVT